MQGASRAGVRKQWRLWTYGDDASGVVYGAGLNYSFTPTMSGRVEVQKPASDSTIHGVGIVFKF